MSIVNSHEYRGEENAKILRSDNRYNKKKKT